MKAAQVEAALNVCTTLEEFPSCAGHRAIGWQPRRLRRRASGLPRARPSPRWIASSSSRDDPKVVAIGETGLDYYRLPEPLDWQRERFRVHIRAARACGKPLIIHTRAAAADTLRLMREEGAEQVGGVMHCFTETAEVARQAMDLGFHISFSGIVTFKNAKELQAAAAGSAAGPPADRDRRAVPGAGSASRPNQRAVLRAACCGEAGRAAWTGGCRDSSCDDRQFLSFIQNVT